MMWGRGAKDSMTVNITEMGHVVQFVSKIDIVIFNECSKHEMFPRSFHLLQNYIIHI